MTVYILSRGYHFEDAQEVCRVYTSLKRSLAEGAEMAKEFLLGGGFTEWSWTHVDNVYKFEFSGSDHWPNYVRVEAHEVIE